jgi:hypothetical protein
MPDQDEAAKLIRRLDRRIPETAGPASMRALHSVCTGALVDLLTNEPSCPPPDPALDSIGVASDNSR